MLSAILKSHCSENEWFLKNGCCSKIPFADFWMNQQIPVKKKSNIVFFSFDFYFSNFFPVKKSVKGELCQKFFKAIFNDAAF